MNKQLRKKARATKKTQKAETTQQPEMMLLEPRIMLDANLGWTVGSADDLTDALEGINIALQTDMAAFDLFTAQLDAALTTALGDVAQVLGGDDAALDFVATTIDALKASAQKLKDGAGDLVDAALSDGAATNDRETFTTSLAATVGTWLFTNADLATDDPDYDPADPSAVGFDQATKDALQTLIPASAIGDIFDGFRETGGDLKATIAAVLTPFQTKIEQAGLTLSDAQAALADAVNARLDTVATLAGETFTVALTDFTTSDDVDVTYTYDATDDNVDVAIALPAFDVDLNALFSSVLTNAALPIDLTLSDDGATLGYTIEATQTTDVDDDLTSIGFVTKDFAIGNLLTLAGDLGTSDKSLSLGLLDLAVDSVDIADFQVSVGALGLQSGVTANLAAATITATQVTTAATVAVTTQIKEAATGAAFQAITDDSAYKLLAVNLSGAADFVTGLTDANATDDEKLFDADIVLSATLKDSTATTAEDRFTAFLASGGVDISFDLSASVANAAQRATMETALNSLATLTATEVAVFLNDITRNLGDVLSNAAFDVTAPFTNINVGDAVSQIGEALKDIPRAFLIDPTALGFTLGSPVALSVSPTAYQVTGSALNASDYAFLKDIEVAHLRLITDTGTVQNVAVDLDLSANTILSGGSPSNAAVLAEFVKQLNSVISGYGLAAKVVGSAIGFIARHPGNNPFAPISGLSLVGVTRRDAASVDDTVGLGALGFSAAKLTTQTAGFATDGDDTLGGGIETQLSFSAITGVDLTIGDDFATDTQSVTSLVVEVTQGGTTTPVIVTKPTGGWTTPAIFATSLNTAFSSASLSFSAFVNVDGTGVTVTSTGGSSFTLNTDSATPLQSQLSSAVNEQVADRLATADIAALKTYEFLTLKVPTGNLLTDGSLEVADVKIDLEDVAILKSATATDLEILEAVATAMNTGLQASHGITVSIESGVFKVALDNNPLTPAKTFSIIGAKLRDVATFDEDVSLANLGFDANATADVLEALSDTGLTETVLSFSDALTQQLTFGDTFATEMAGVDQLRFTVTEDGVTRFVDVVKPTSGWVTAGEPDYAKIAIAFNAAFTAAGAPIVASVLAGGTGLDFAVTAGHVGIVTFGVDIDELTRGLTLSGVTEWVNEELQASPLFVGSTLKLTEAGELVLTLPDAAVSATIASTNQLSGISAEDLGLGNLADLSLSANLTAQLNASLSASAGIDLGALSTLFTGSTSLLEAMGDSVFLSDVSIEAGLRGTAANVTGTANLGLFAVNIGGSTPASNFLALDLQMDAGLISQAVDGTYSSKITLNAIKDAVSSTGNLTDLLGRYDLQGGILTDGAAKAVTTGGTDVTTATGLVFADTDTFTPGADQELVAFFAQLGDVAIDMAGIGDLNSALSAGISLSVTDPFDGMESFNARVYSDDADTQTAIDTLANLDSADILDTLSAMAQVLVVAGETLSDTLPFLAGDIPLLNFSLLDAVSYSKDFVDAVRDVRDNPQGALRAIENVLEEVFGADTVTLDWDSTNQTLLFDLEFAFLEDYQEELPFNIDLAALLGTALRDKVDGSDAIADLIGGIADVSGDGTFVFDPDLAMHFAFGLDLSPTLGAANSKADGATVLDTLATAFMVNTNGASENDIAITWQAGTAAAKTVSISLDGVTTVAAAVAAINTAVSDTTTGFGSNVSFVFDAATGQITLADSTADTTDDADVTTLFGAAEAAGTRTDAADPYVLNFATTFTNFGAAYSFDLTIGTPGETVTVSLDADAARTTKAAFATALNAALGTVDVPRGVLGDAAGPLINIAVDQLITAQLVDGNLQLTSTGFAVATGYDRPVFSVAGIDSSADVQFTITELGSSNAARLLGFTASDAAQGGIVTSEVLTKQPALNAPRIYLDTAKSKITATLDAGIDGGLNVTLGIGPLEINVVNGTAKLTDGAGSDGAATFGLNFVDADGTADDKYELDDLFDIANDANRSYLEILKVNAAIGVDIDLPFSDNAGFFKPEDHKLIYNSDLLKSTGKTLAEFDSNDIGASFTGDLITLGTGGSLDASKVTLVMPAIGDLLGDFNYLAFLNNPKAVLDGLDIILDQMQALFDNYLGDIELPVVGDAIGAGVTFFDDFRYKVLEAIRVKAETPKADGTLPTTVDLLTNEVNNLLNSLFGTTNIEYMQANLVIEDNEKESYLVGALNFSEVLFDANLAIDFDFGVPGLDLEVDQGSDINFQLDYVVNIGFGIDQRGFFLLNDTDDAEVSISITADAGTFAGSANVLGVLGLKAKAVTLNGSGNIDTSAGGTAVVSATVGADLFGDDGTDIKTGSDARDLTGLDLRDASDDELFFETLIYFNEIDYSNLIDFSFAANFDIQVGLSGSVLDPTTGNPITVGGIKIIPEIATEILIKGVFTLDDGLDLQKLSFENVRLDAGEIYDALLEPILTPILEVVNPVAEYFEWTQETPFKQALSAAGKAFPILGIADQAITIGLQARAIANQFASTGGMLVFGDFDFSGNSDDYASGDAKLSDNATSVTAKTGSGASVLSGTGAAQFGVFGNIQSGIAIEIPLLSQPTNILNLILGNFDEVDLAVAHLNLFNIDTGRIDLADELISAVGLPGWAASVIRSAFQAELSLKFKAGFSAGYDLGGIVNFVNTLDPERLLDGVFIVSAPGSLISAEVTGSIGINAGIAGANADVGAGVNLSFNDPNRDGKLRIPEMIALLDAAADAISDGDIGTALGTIFVGDAYYRAKLSVWAGINLPWPLPDLKWSTTVFNIGDTITFGGLALPAEITNVSGGNTNTLNIGARAGASLTTIVDDGDDVVTVTGNSTSGYSVTYAQSGKSTSGSVGSNAAAIVIPAGEGNNVINLDGISGTAKPTIVYTGAGTDTITLPKTGMHVVFAGDGNDRISTSATSTGTYIIFGEGGSDTLNIKGGNVIYLAGDDFGARDLFQAKFKAGNITEAAIRDFFGINANGTPNAAATQTNFELNGTDVNLAGLLAGYTAGTQLSAERTTESVTLGAGNHIVLTGGGNDTITVNGTTTTRGTMTVLSGAGDDTVTINNGGTVLVEGGAGSDQIDVNATASTLWGYAAVAGQEGLIGTAAGTAIDALAVRDGADIIKGGAGVDRIYGQLGNDVLEGGRGNDVLHGGIGNDIIFGGDAVVKDTVANAAIKIAQIPTLGKAITVSVANLADGNDSITGGVGSDVILGGGGDDTISSGAAGDVVFGDFGQVGLSANLIAQSAKTEFDTSTNAGNDIVRGDGGNDILIVGGGGTSSVKETVVDLEGSNIVIGDFGEVSGARITEAVTKVTAFASDAGSDDTITTGRGNDIILGGEGDDVINAGAGGDFVIGDLGILDITTSTFTSIQNDDAGDDTITFAAATGDPVDNVIDVVIGGAGNDTATGQNGGMVFLGDDGKLTLDPVALTLLQTYTAPATGATAADLAKDAQTRASIANIAAKLESTGGTGNDTVSLTAGELRAILGSGNDTATNTGDDAVYVLGDNGTIEFLLKSDTTVETGTGATTNVTRTQVVLNDAAATNVVLTSASATADGSDTITAGGGEDYVVGGGGADTITVGGGDNWVLGDSGEIRDVALTQTVTASQKTGTATTVVSTTVTTADIAKLTSASTTTDGADTITAGAGVDQVIGGGGGDTITIGDGANLVLGDSGMLETSVATVAATTGSATTTTTTNTLTRTSASAGTDGADDITTGTGVDQIIAGGGGDTVTAGAGDNVVLGDSGSFDGAVLASDGDTSRDGADRITALGGVDRIIAGGGGDTVAAGNGTNVILGDSGSYTGTTLTSATDARDGDDTITTGTDRDLIIAGGRADTITAGNGDNVVIGDSGSFDGAVVTSALTTRDGNDSVTAGTGNDWVVLGQGDDTADLGAGNNRAIGDSGVLTAATLTSTSNADGGNDTIDATTGRDVVIGGAGADEIDLGAGNNSVLGDAGLINETTSTMSSTRTTGDGADEITTLGGTDEIIAGGGADTVAAGDGDNVILGDSGSYAVTGANTVLTSVRTDGDGDDEITTGTGTDQIIAGGGGDTVTAGAGDNTILGDSGSYTVTDGDTALTSVRTDGDGDDEITTGTGTDQIIAGGGGDTVTAGAGDNTILGDSGSYTVTDGDTALTSARTIGDGADEITTLGGTDQIIAGGGGDTVNAGDGNNTILGDSGSYTVTDGDTALTSVRTIGDGADEITTLGGTDQIIAGGGGDTVAAGDGDNVVLGDSGSYTVTGANTVLTSARTDGDGADTITTGTGTDQIIAGADGDRVTAGAGDNVVIGDSGRYTVVGTTQSVTSERTADDGNDTISTTTGTDRIIAGGGADTVDAGAGDNVILGDSGSFVTTPTRATLTSDLTDGDANDTITAGDGSDWIIAGGDADVVDAANGENVVIGDSGSFDRTATTLNLTSVRTTADGTDTITTGNAKDLIIAGGAGDTITAGAGDNVILGDSGTYDGTTLASDSVTAGDGADRITTLGGADQIIGGGAGDTIAAGAGANTVIGDSGSLNGSVTTSATDAMDGADEITTGDAADVIIGGGAGDTITAGDGTNVVIGDSGSYNGMTVQSAMTARDGDDTITTGADRDLVIAGGGGDTVTAGDGDNVVIGDSGSYDGTRLSSVSTDEDGSDVIVSGVGSDQIIAGGGGDTVTAGAGDNVVLGDSGSYDGAVMASDSDTSRDGADTITTLGGADQIIAGGGGDTVAAGDGTNVILGDSGSYDGTTLTSATDARDDADTITTGTDRDLIIAGGRADTITAGNGDNVVIGDSGSFDGAVVTSALTTRDGNDSVTAGTGNDWVVLGQGDDTADLGAGNNRAIGDSGVLTAATLTSTSNADGGNDTIDATTGRDVVIGGAGADEIDLGAGNNSVLGDAGVINETTSTMSSTRTTGDGADTITTLGGTDEIIAGGGADTVDAGDGDNVILGDSGSYAVTGANTVLTSARTDGDGADDITTGTGTDQIIAGGGGDTVAAGDGNNTILGDSGSYTVTDGDTALTSERTIGDGADEITTLGGTDQIIAGGGADTVDAGDGDNTILGDSGSYTVTDGDTALTSARTIGDGADEITTLGGTDQIIAGGGGDTVDAGEGDNTILGDSGSYAVTGANTVLTSVRTIGDGADEITTLGGTDQIIAGGGGDTVAAGDGDNVVLGDSGSYTVTGANTVLTSARTDGDGADTITTGTGTDQIIAGADGDRVTAGAGDNVVIGDSGRYTVVGTTQSVTSERTADDGNDTISTTTGTDRIIAGGGADTVDAGAGDNVILGDSGSFVTTPTRATLTSDLTDGDANDTITAGDGSDWIIAGGDADVVDAANGENVVIGDSGSFDRTAARTELISEATTRDGADEITTGVDTDLIIAGGDADTVTGGAGDNVILGDSGSFVQTADRATLTSELTAEDANDTITAGDGFDWIIAGGDADVVDAANGENVVIGDSGSFDQTAARTELISEATTRDGADEITTGVDTDLIIAGGDADTVTAGDGHNVILGDSGSFVVDGTDRTLISELTTRDGDDVVTAGDGDDWVILGQGDDTANLSDGDNRALGDSGTIVQTDTLTLTTTSDSFGGKDGITTGAGDDIVLAGSDDDTVVAGAGDNAILGDNGEVLYDPQRTTGLTEIRTVSEENGGADTITTEGGRDIIVAGEKGDTITSGAGADIVLGDQGFVTGSSATVDGVISSLIDEVPGDDIIDAGAGDDLIVAGLGSDRVNTGEGEDLALGDSGIVTFIRDAQLVTVTLTDEDRGGNDVITGAGSLGDKVLIGQFGEDRITGGASDDVIFGDLGLIEFLPYAERFAGQSSADRVTRIEAVRADLIFDDTIFGGAGSDFIMGGMGSDVLVGDDGQDILIGDTAILTRAWDTLGGGLIESTTIDTNFAFVTGGFDQIRGGLGNDIMIGGLGRDLFFGNTQLDLIYSDGYAGIFTADWSGEGYFGETPKRFLLTSNFAGTGAVDVVSESQQDSSIGGPLDFRAEDLRFEDNVATYGRTFQDVLSAFGNSTATLDAILAFLGQNSTTESIVLLLMNGADLELIMQALMEEIMSQLILASDMDQVQLEALVRMLIAEYLSNAGLVDDTQSTETVPTETQATAFRIAAE